MRRLLAIAGLIAACAAIALQVRWIPYHPSRTEFPVRGLDVSHHQGAIDWQAVADGDARFAYIKATEGGDWNDPRFDENWSAAAAAGVPRGAYHFFTLCRPGVEQAANFIATVPNEALMLPPAVDLEYGGNCADAAAQLSVDQELTAFLDRVETHYAREVLIYATSEFYRDHLRQDGRNNPLWLRSLFVAPRYHQRSWTLWQYSGFGRSPGVSGPVDWNVFAGTAAEFAAWRGERHP